MPLSPAEVHNVAFKKPPIGKRGYDEEEVDAFLDVVEVELSRLIEENNDLKGRTGDGASADGSSTPVASDAGGAVSTELASTRDENRRLQSHVAELERTLSQSKNGLQQQVVQLQRQLSQTEQQLAESRQQLEDAKHAGASHKDGAAAGSDVHVQAVQVLALAQQTADQHLTQTKAEAERLLSEATKNAESTVSKANTEAESTVSEAKTRSEKNLGDAEARAKKLDEESTSRATRTVQDAEQRATTITAQLEQRRVALVRSVEELRTFEREYRSRLKSYLESQLRDLDASGKAEPARAADQQDSKLADA